MVGFAGETEEEFEHSLAFAREIGFAKAHIFAYSRRKGTRADLFPNQVQNAKKAERSRKMIAAGEECEIAFLDSQIDRRFPVLFETCENGFCEGYTPNYTRVRAKGENAVCGKICEVLTVSREGDCLIAEIL